MSKLGKIVGEKNVVLTARREKSEVGKLLKELAKNNRKLIKKLHEDRRKKIK